MTCGAPWFWPPGEAFGSRPRSLISKRPCLARQAVSPAEGPPDIGGVISDAADSCSRAEGEKMSYLVFALGALLSLCGAFAVAAGYGIIQVERGWAGVIAGATALSGGIVTIALGFILHGLSGLHALLKTGKGLTPLARELGEDGASEFRAEPGLAFNPEASVASEAG